MFRKKRSEIAVIILDLIMPGMGGKQCLKEIIKIDPHANIVIASGYSGDAESMDVLESYVQGFINKPYNVNQMLRVIRNILDKCETQK
jgi:DNA-binding NtrC family response regulator